MEVCQPWRHFGLPRASLLKKKAELKLKNSKQFADKFWREIKSSPQEIPRRYHHASVLYNDKLFIYGGFQSNAGILNDFRCFHSKEGNEKWEILPILNGPGPRHSHSAIIFEQTIYVFGGKISIMSNTNSLYLYHIPTKKWKQLQLENGPPATDSHEALLKNGEMIIFGGFANNNCTNDIFILNLKKREWRKVYETLQHDVQPHPRLDFSLILRNNKIYMYGGVCPHHIFGDLWQFDLEQQKFTPVQCIQPYPRAGHSAVLYQDKMLIFGGMSGVTHQRNDLIYFEFDCREWSILWENSDKENQYFNYLESKKFKSSKKNSVNSKPLEANFRSLMTRNFRSKTRKYRRPLREGIAQKKTNDRLNRERHKRQNQKKTMLLSQFQPQQNDNLKEERFSPLIETLNHSIFLTSSTKGNPMYLSFSEYDNQMQQVFFIKPRDGHTADLMASGKEMIIFGGDRHTISHNDIVIINLGELFNSI